MTPFSADDFCAEALRIYMTRFDFKHNPLDVALRKLLMHMSLPRETQQIDRIIEAFAVRYEQCEPGLFVQTGESTRTAWAHGQTILTCWLSR